MTGSVNKTILIGNLCAAPEARSMQSGGEVVSFRLATNETWVDKQSGERKQKVEFHNVVIFNEGLAKVAKQYLRKGSQCYVEGALQTRKWTDQNGADRYTTEIVLQRFRGELVLTGGKPEGQSDTRQADRQPSRGSATQSDFGGGFGGGAELDDDVPFGTNDPRMESRVG